MEDLWQGMIRRFAFASRPEEPERGFGRPVGFPYNF